MNHTQIVYSDAAAVLESFAKREGEKVTLRGTTQRKTLSLSLSLSLFVSVNGWKLD